MVTIETAILWSLLSLICGMGIIIFWTRYPFTIIMSTNEEFDPYLIETVKKLDIEKRKQGATYREGAK